MEPPNKKSVSFLSSQRTWILALSIAVLVILVVVIVLITRSDNSPATMSPATVTPSSSGGLQNLGIKITLPADLKDVKYSSTAAAGAASNYSIVGLSTDEYMTLVNKCLGLAANTTQNFATLYRGEIVSGITPPQTSLKQLDTFYIGNLGPTTPGPTCKDESTQKELNSLSSSLNTSLQQAMAGAAKL
jgi:hypothetical protein